MVEIVLICRVIETALPFASIRYVEEQFSLGTDERKVEKFYGNEVQYDGKAWHKQSLH